MACDDTRLHRLEAMVAGLLAWQNVAEKELVRLQERVGSTEVHLHSAQEEWRARVADTADKLEALGDCRLPARVAALEHTVGVVLENYRSHLERDHEHKHVEWLEADLQAGGPEPAAAPVQAAQPAPQQPRSCTNCGEPTKLDAPCSKWDECTALKCWQPRCGDCKWQLTTICGRCKDKGSWQPRSGGGAP